MGRSDAWHTHTLGPRASSTARRGLPGRVGVPTYPGRVPETTAPPRPGTTSIDGTEPSETRVPGLSPSRANDYLQCPLLFRFRVVDRLPEPPSAAAVRGTLVHAVLENLYDLPAAERTAPAARAMLPEQWERLVAERPECVEVLDDPEDLRAWFAQAGELVDTYFTLEDPQRLEPESREVRVDVPLEDGPALRGVVDRIDVAPDGAIRIVDYKTGRSPRAGFESGALFQMRFYALVVSRLRDVVPAMLQLVYLGDGTLLRHVPSPNELVTTERRIRAIWSGIQAAGASGDWRPRPGPLCDWCAHRSLCPAFGGTPPEVDPAAVERALGVTPVG